MQTSLQTSVRRLAVRSLIPMCLMDGKPPFGHDRACSLASYNEGLVHHEMHPCGVQNRILQSAEQLAKKRLLSLEQGPWKLE